MHPQPLFKIFGHGIYPYGICFAVGILLCFAFLFYAMKKKRFSEHSTDAIVIIGVLGTGLGVLFGMLFQSFYNFLADPEHFDFGASFGNSMTFLGGLLGGTLTFLAVWNLYIYVIRPRTKLKMFKGEMNAGLTDALPFIPIGITIAHALGRFGCFWAGCCYGRPTDAWYGLPCAAGHTGNYVPMQLFEMFFLIALAIVMAVLYFKFDFNYNFAVYGIAYGVWRFVIEFFRGDARGEFLGEALSPSQIWSIVLVLIGIGFIFLQKYVLEAKMLHPETHPVVETERAPESKPEAVMNAPESDSPKAPESKPEKSATAKKPVPEPTDDDFYD